jgi:hypothetical protein
VAILTDSLAEALDRIDDFHAVHRGRPAGEHLGSVVCLQESVGIHDDVRKVLRARLPLIPGVGAQTGQVLMGIVIGLMAAQLAAESDGEVALSG